MNVVQTCALPFCGLRGKWEDWMVDGEGIVAGHAKEPSRKLIAEWLVEVYTNIPVGMGWNAWKKRDTNG